MLFLQEPLSAARTVKVIPTRAGVDEVHDGPGVLYFRRLIARVTQTQLTKLIAMPIYQQMTIRNWNTTTALCRLASGG